MIVTQDSKAFNSATIVLYLYEVITLNYTPPIRQSPLVGTTIF